MKKIKISSYFPYTPGLQGFCWFHFTLQDKEVVADVYQVEHSVLRQPFQWHPKLPDVEPNSTKTISCRNSVQGKLLLVDERGIVPL